MIDTSVTFVLVTGRLQTYLELNFINFFIPDMLQINTLKLVFKKILSN